MSQMKNIFLVEDDLDDQLFFAEALSEIKDTSLLGIANNGREALDKVNTSPILPDFIFMDINMPVMNGIDCLKEVMKNPHLSQIPVIMLSTSNLQVQLSHQLGASGYIQKPSDLGLLHRKIEQIINLDLVSKDHTARPTFISI